ncbi:MAG TPA: tetratricopeptide repeat protein, partial [Gemmatimonadaceae bacterium]|nr:tetratricopeptide repeat protein [Gemmatimonadaceae bacterium]
MASTARIDELKKKFDENPRRYFAPLANEFRKAGDIEQAIMICEEFLPQQPGHMSGHIVYGQALFEAARFDESRTVFETALTLDPENLIALRHLGDIAKGQGDLDSARKWYDRVLEADPRNDEIQALIASLDGLSAAPAAEHAPADLQTHASPEEQRFAPPAIPQAPPAIPHAPPAIPHAPPPLPEPIDLDIVGDVSTEMPATVPIQPVAPQAELPVERAEGLESVEFTPPSGPLDRAHDLGVDLQPSEFTAPAAPVAPMAGLEETAIGAFERVPDGGPPLPMLDTSEPMSPPPPRAPASDEIPDVGPSTLEFEVPTATERAAVRGRAETATMPELEAEGNSLPEARTSQPAELPPELPPSVIAAEAELMDLGEPVVEASARDAATPAPEAPPVPREEPASARAVPAIEHEVSAPVRTTTPQAPFVTETMAELFLKQGFREQALDVYRQLSAANPTDARLQQRVAELQPPAPAAVGDSVRDFLARLAVLRPGERAAAAVPPSDDDFAGVEAAAPAEPVVHPPAAQALRPTPASTMSTGLERGASSQGTGGTIDALFGNRAPVTSEDSAASALAQAFGGAPEPAPAITGRPARAAAGELSLDSVFRDGPPRPPRASQSFSFDQFFSPESATPERAPAPSAAPA